MDHPEISAGWLSRLFYHWTGPLQRKGLSEPQVNLDDLYPLLPEDRRDGRADAFLALTAAQPVRPGPSPPSSGAITAGALACSPCCKCSACWRPLASPRLLNHSMTQLGAGAPTEQKLLLAFALFASVLASGMLAEHSLQLALKMHVPIRRLLAESLLAKVMKLGGKSFDDRAGGRVQNLINRDVWDITWIWLTPPCRSPCCYNCSAPSPCWCGRWAAPALVGFAVLTLLLLISTRVVRRMNQQEQQLKRQQDERNGIWRSTSRSCGWCARTGSVPSSPGPPATSASRSWGCWGGCSGSMPSTKA